MNYSDLIEQLKSVFPDALPPSFTLYDGQREDDYGLFSSEYEAVGRKLRWHEIRLIDLQETPFAMLFLPPGNQHYYLPAYLHHALLAWEKGEESDWRLERGFDFVLNKLDETAFVALFSSEQVDFIIAFLKALMIAEPVHNVTAIQAILLWESVGDRVNIIN